MNKQCFRVVFNKARGMMMVVSEVTKSDSKTAGDGSRNNASNKKVVSHKPNSLSRLTIAILCCQSMVYTQVQAATSAIQNTASNIPIDQRAALLKAANGAPIVNIRTPNSNGLSHNTYNQFDIGSNGAILNNSMGGVNTQLAGAIAGNQYLALGAANTILNEVRSSAPVKFEGNLEVGGQRADVIIASPSGLQIQGGGFINANRATLTTGTPKIDSAGNLTGFDVKQGQVQFDNDATGNALGGTLYDTKNKNQANYVDVLARAVVINGQINATQDVDMVIGSNTVDYDTGAATKITGTGVAPTLAVDVSALGGIYANSINLIGTESGLGVRNAGNIKATQQIVLTNSGKIENTGSIETTKAQTSLVSIDATGTTGSIAHSGTISSYGMIDIQADKDITLNKGIVKKNSAGKAVQLMPDIIRIDAGGSLKVSNGSDVRNLNVDDQTNIYTHSTLDTTVDSKSAIASNGGVSIDADRYARVLDTGSISAGSAALSISSKSGTTVDNATVTGRSDVYIASATADTTISNNSQLSAQKSLTISAGRDATLKSGSKVVAANDLTIAATRNATIDTAGSIKVTNDANIKAGELAYLKDSIQPITIGKQLTIEGKQATVLNSTANANDGIYISSQDKDITITNSILNSEKGAVTAIANQAALTVNKLTTNANSTILAAGSNVGITTSSFNTDNIVVESGATTTINGLTTAAKDTTQIGGTSISSKENTSVSNSTLNSTGNTVMRSDLGLALTNNDIQSQGIVLKTNTAKTLKNAAGINNTFGEGDITLTKNKLQTNGINDNSNGIIIDAANHLNVVDSQTKSTGSTSLKSGNLMRVNNSTVDAGKNIAIDSGHQVIFNGERKVGTKDTLIHTTGNTTLNANEVASINSRYTQSYKDTDVKAGAVLLESGSFIQLTGNTNLSATGSTKLAANKEKMSDGKGVNTLNGDLSLNSYSSLTIDPKLVALGATGDINLASRNGTLYLKGYKGTQGLGSEQVVKLKTAGDINLSGKEVLLEGSDLNSFDFKISGGIFDFKVDIKPTDINITATNGSVELKGVKNSFTNSVSQYKINTINSEIANAQAELNQPFFDTKWVEEFNKQKADWTQFVYVDCIKSPFRSSSECRQKRINDMGIAERSRPNYFKMIKSANYQDYMSFLSRQETLRGTLSDLTQVLATSQRASTGFEHKASSIRAGKDINITARQGVLIEGADISSSIGGINILAEGNLAATTIVGTDPTTNISKTYLNNDSIRITGLADIYQQGNMSNGTVTGPNYSYHQLVNQPKLTAKGDITIAAQGKLAKATDAYNSVSKTYNTNNAVILNSADIISTGGNVRIDAALGDINLEASQAAFMDGSQTTTTKRKWYGKKKTTTTTKTSNNANAITTDIQANNISLTADGNIRVYGSELDATPTGKINLTAGNGSYLYAIDNVNYSSTDVQKRSSWLGIRYNKDHTNDTRQELSQLPAKLVADSTNLKSGGNTVIQGTIFNSNSDNIQVGVGPYAEANATLILDTITNQINTTHTQDRESTVWMKTVDQGSVVTTASLPKFNQAPTITSPNGVVVGVPVEVTVDVNNKAKSDIQKSSAELGKLALELSKQPGYEYLATLDKTNDINWVQVDLIQKNWDYTQEGLTPGAAALIAIAVTIATSGVGGAAGMGATLTGTTGAMGAASTAAFSSLAAQASVTLINNKGDIGKTLEQLASSATVRSMATAALTAGVGAQLGLGSAATDTFGQKLANGVGTGLTQAVADAVINGVSFEEALKNGLRGALVDVFAAETFGKFVKNFEGDDFASELAHKLAAAGVGCVAASAKQQSCSAGAIGAAVGEMVAQLNTSEEDELLTKLGIASPNQLSENENIASLTTGAIALLLNLDVNMAASSAVQAVRNNHNIESANKVQISDADAAKLKAIIAVVLPTDTVEAVINAVKKGTSYKEIGTIIGIGGAAYLTKSGKLSDIGKFLKTKNISCFVAGTLIETIDGLKAIETIEQGDLIWSRHEETLEYGYRPVVDTVSFDSKEIYEVVVKDNNGKLETYQTTEEHPFWVVDTGWLPASLLQTGMTLVNRNDEAVLTVVSQNKLNKTDTVYNFEVAEFHTYHTGEFGVWVHNATCAADNMSSFFSDFDFGQRMKNKSVGTKLKYDGQKVYQVTTKDADSALKKGDFYYLDGLHKDHIEVFDKNGNFIQVLNLDGTQNLSKTTAGRGRKINVK